MNKFAIALFLLIVVTLQAHAKNAMHIVINNHLGAPEILVDENQEVVWQAEYDEFGEANIIVEEVEFNARLPGQYYDRESGLHYNYYRDYDASLGRYVQSDPIGLAGGINTYAYALGNPVMYIDYLGLDIVIVTGGVRDGSMNIFGHVGGGVTGYGMGSYGNDTSAGSSIADYINSQSQVRAQQITVIPTSVVQDALAIDFIKSHPNMNDVGKFDNCAVRTNQLLNAAGISTNGIPFPGGTARDVQSLPGTTTYFIPQHGSIPQGLQNVIGK